MSRGPIAFKQADVRRAVRGAIAAGLSVTSVEIDTSGKIRVVATIGIAPSQTANDLDDELKVFEAQHGQS